MAGRCSCVCDFIDGRKHASKNAQTVGVATINVWNVGEGVKNGETERNVDREISR